MQVDVTATPRNKHGAIFVQTIADYPLVEAIYQDVVNILSFLIQQAELSLMRKNPQNTAKNMKITFI